MSVVSVLENNNERVIINIHEVYLSKLQFHGNFLHDEMNVALLKRCSWTLQRGGLKRNGDGNSKKCFILSSTVASRDMHILMPYIVAGLIMLLFHIYQFIKKLCILSMGLD